MTTEAFDGHDDTIGFEADGGRGSFVVEGSGADEDDGTDGDVRLFLLEGCA